MSRVLFSSLPTEIWIHILSYLSWSTLLRLKQVSKTFRRLIEGDPYIQYATLLGMAAYEDVGSCKEPVSARTDNLKSIETSFKTGSFPTKTTMLINSATPTYDLQGGVYVQGRRCEDGSFHTAGVDVYRLPSLLYPSASWKLANFAVPIRDFTLSAHDDLLVTIEDVPLHASTE